MDAARTNTDVLPNPSCPGCVAAARCMAELERQNALLQARVALLEQKLEAALRAGKRQAAPFARGLPKSDPKPPGRKSGEDYGTQAFRAVPPPEVIDETYEAPLPERCPRCGARRSAILTHIDQQYQVEIPRKPIYRQFNVAVGRCSCCQARLQGRHPLQTSDALGCCASQIGPDAQAAAVLLNKELGLSQGKISRLFASLFGIQLTRGGSCQIMLRAAQRCAGNYQAILQRVQASPAIRPDETGWRIGGYLAWLHVAVGQDAVAYLIARQRGFEASTLLIGENYQGTMIHDGWASYDRFWRCRHQTCLAHLLRRCRELLARATGGAVLFPRQVQTLLQEGLAIRDRRDTGPRKIQPATAARRAEGLQERMKKLLQPIKTHAGNERLAEHLWKHRGQLFTFLRQPGIEATNYRAEQALRPAVVNRKVWGGNRTPAGAQAQGILMSVLFTAAKHGRDALAFVSQVLRAVPQGRPLLLAASG
jgi:transposase